MLTTENCDGKEVYVLNKDKLKEAFTQGVDLDVLIEDLENGGNVKLEVFSEEQVKESLYAGSIMGGLDTEEDKEEIEKEVNESMMEYQPHALD